MPSVTGMFVSAFTPQSPKAVPQLINYLRLIVFIVRYIVLKVHPNHGFSENRNQRIFKLNSPHKKRDYKCKEGAVAITRLMIRNLLHAIPVSLSFALQIVLRKPPMT
ncbi:hypothetical protein [Herbaspirillum sp. SJZ107]|uniref:hypothetical protein n=1 Tax=Herbaspirillum sp. SJZ107 TaxID=2572881 RepID=UPI00115165A8|nr:hypothetical protein [Herbaspirillum sp. SJZ107]